MQIKKKTRVRKNTTCNTTPQHHNTTTPPHHNTTTPQHHHTCPAPQHFLGKRRQAGTLPLTLDRPPTSPG